MTIRFATINTSESTYERTYLNGSSIIRKHSKIRKADNKKKLEEKK